MNARTAVLRVVDGQAAIERLDAIAQAIEPSLRVVSVDRHLEGHRAICVKHADRCLGPA